MPKDQKMRHGAFRLLRFRRIALVVSAVVLTGACSFDHGMSNARTTSNGLHTSVAGLAAGHGRLAGHVGPGRPDGQRLIPPMTLGFSNGAIVVKTTARDGVYYVDLPAGTWEVHADAGNVCATGLKVVAAAWQSNDLIWPIGSCQNLSGPPGGPSPPAGPVPPGP
jgi:hypothetical protein